MNNNYFLYVGNAYPHKNLERLIKAIVLLNTKSGHLVSLRIVSGKNAFYERLIRTIDKLDAKKYVDLLGFVNDEELKQLYKKSAGYVFPSLMEGFGLPGLEAINAGTLLLASDIPVLKEVYDSQAIFFDPLDISSIAGAMEKALGLSKKEREKQIDSGKEFAKRYSWAKMAKETLKIYEKIGQSSNSIRPGE